MIAICLMSDFSTSVSNSNVEPHDIDFQPKAVAVFLDFQEVHVSQKAFEAFETNNFQQ